MSLAQWQKRVVWKRDNFTCFYCGTCCRDKPTVDHYVPKSRGGGNEFANLVTACLPCNTEKADRHPGRFIAAKRPNASKRHKRKANPADAAIRKRAAERKMAARRSL